MSHLDYCSANYLHVARDSEEQDELVPCPGSILRAVARILIERRERDLATPVECPERRKLLQRVALLEEESFATLIATLPHFADNLSSNSGS